MRETNAQQIDLRKGQYYMFIMLCLKSSSQNIGDDTGAWSGYSQITRLPDCFVVDCHVWEPRVEQCLCTTVSLFVCTQLPVYVRLSRSAVSDCVTKDSCPDDLIQVCGVTGMHATFLVCI